MLTKYSTHIPILSVPLKCYSKLSCPFSNTCSSSSKLISFNHPFNGKIKKIRFLKKSRLMEERVIKISALGSGDSEDNNFSVFEQENLIGGSHQSLPVSYLEATLNSLSKWIVAVLFGVIILYRHDTESLWAVMGSIINTALSVILKRILNQQRPVSDLRSDPGMPSSHAQSIFYTVVFIIMSMVESQGVNKLTLIFATASLVFGSYLSWLRVSQQLHTISQVTVGAVLGSCFSLMWLWSWDAIVSDAFSSYLWVQVFILSSAAILGFGFLSYVIRNWLSDERR